MTTYFRLWAVVHPTGRLLVLLWLCVSAPSSRVSSFGPLSGPRVHFLHSSSLSKTVPRPTAVGSVETSSERWAVASPRTSTAARRNDMDHRRASGGRQLLAFISTIIPRGGDIDARNRQVSSSSSALSLSLPSPADTLPMTNEEDAVAAVSPENWALLSPRGRHVLAALIAWDQAAGRDGASQRHVYGNWPAAGLEDAGKTALTEQLADLDDSYPGGIVTYLTKAAALLRESADGLNPFAEYIASVPVGESLCYEDDLSSTGGEVGAVETTASTSSLSFGQAEALGMNVVGDCVFVLVAGGLGERLGYSGIKLELHTNLCTSRSYLEKYVRYIQALEQQTNKPAGTIPLVIMTSGDTDAGTRELLAAHHNYGMPKGQISIVTQDKVPALQDGQAGLALAEHSRWEIQTKPHGHGDIHHLLYKNGFTDQWEAANKKYVVFLQDTNVLVVNSVVPTLGVSVFQQFVMNSICIPRLAGEAAGAITRLGHQTDPSKSLVINVEYNQLDPLLRSQGTGEGDVADPATGYSPFPGNANNFVIEVKAYAQTLRGQDQGVVTEFVNPKYKDDTRTTFKKPTRLECMMQDLPKLFQKELGSTAVENIGFTMFRRWFTFSPAKNSLESGQMDVSKGSTAPGTMSSAESDLYIQNQRKLRDAGVQVHVSQSPSDMMSMAGIPVTRGPFVVLSPFFATTRADLRSKIDRSGTIQVSQRSALVLDGTHIHVKNLTLDGALVVQAGPETHLTIDGLTVENKGWELTELDPGQEYPESVRIRGYTMTKHDTHEIILTEPGEFVVGPSGIVTKK